MGATNAIGAATRRAGRALSHDSAAPPLILAAAMFAAVTAWRFSSADPIQAIGFLYTVPIALVAARFGIRGGLAAAAAGMALAVLWALTETAVSIPLTNHFVRAATFVAVAAVVGTQVERRSRVEREAERWFSLSNDLACVANLEGYLTRVNGSWRSSLGYSPEELLGRPYVDFVHPDDLERTGAEAAALADPAHTTVRFQNRYRAKDGSWHWLEWSSRSDGTLIYAAARDVTWQKALEAEREDLIASVQQLADTDHLTGLANRRVWSERFDDALGRAGFFGEDLTIVLIDLDDFKTLNDTLGHPAGDRLLKTAAARWQAQLRETDLLARLGGDEFGVLLPNCPVGDQCRVLDRLRETMPSGHTFAVGIASWDGEESAERLLERADQALYRDKKEGRRRPASGQSASTEP